MPVRNHGLTVSSDPRLLSFYPLLYVAWADGELTEEEIQHICGLISTTEGLGLDCRRDLGLWLDPTQPPTARELLALLTAVRKAAAGLPRSERRTLAELGLEIAHLGGREVSADEESALRAVDEALNLPSAEAARTILAVGRPQAAAESEVASFDIDAMTRLLDGSHFELRRELKALLTSTPFQRRYELDRKSYREHVLNWARLLADKGYGALAFPEEAGGSEDLGAMLATFETLAYHDLSLLIKFGVQFGLFAGSIHQLGTAAQHDRYLAAAASLELPGCFAMTETGHGSNVQDLETVAVFDGKAGEFVVHTPHDGARKDYIGNAALHGRMATVFAQLEIEGEGYGVHAFLVPIRTSEGKPCPGVRIEDCGAKEGLNGVDNGRLWFDQVRIPRKDLLGRFASVDSEGNYESAIASPGKRFFTMLGTLVGGRVSIAHAALSVAKTSLAIAIRYGEKRRQFGPAGDMEIRLLDYPTHQKRLLPALATTYALDFALDRLDSIFTARKDEDRRRLEGLAAGLKAYATRHAIDTTQSCREACGGQGYLAENRFAELKADCDVFATFEGDNTVLLQLVTKGLLADFRQQFGNLSFFALTRFLAGKAANVVAELNPVVTRRTDRDHLRSPDFQLAAFRWREQHLLTRLAQRLRSRLGGGMDSFQAFLEVQNHAVDLATAHVEKTLLELFVEAESRVADPDLAAVLATLRCLFALARLEADRGWFLEHGYIEPVKAKAIRALVISLCRELRPQAVPLANAFDIPDALLAAPIALGGSA